MMGIRHAEILIVLAFISFVQASDRTRQETIFNITRNYDAAIPPKYNTDEPVTSVVQLYIINIDSISETTMDLSSKRYNHATSELVLLIPSPLFFSVDTTDFSVSMFVRQKWKDPRLIYNPIPGIRNLELDTKMISEVWVPDLYFYNEKKASFHDVTVPNKLMHIYPDGTVFYSMRISGTYSCKMLLHKYPLDQQECSINMESYGYSMNTLLLRWNEDPVERAPSLSLPQFEFGNITSYICDTTYANVNFTCIGFSMLLNRNYGYYVIQIFIPSILIVCLSWVSFWLNIDAVPARISLGLLTVLTMTTQSSGARESLPRVSYIKAIDIWMATCLFFVFAALVQYAYVNVLARVEQRKKQNKDIEEKTDKPEKEEKLSTVFSIKENVLVNSQNGKAVLDTKVSKKSTDQINKEKARYVDKISRVLFPIAFLSFNIIFWVVYTFWQPSPDLKN